MYLTRYSNYNLRNWTCQVLRIYRLLWEQVLMIWGNSVMAESLFSYKYCNPIGKTNHTSKRKNLRALDDWKLNSQLFHWERKYAMSKLEGFLSLKQLLLLMMKKLSQDHSEIVSFSASYSLFERAVVKTVIDYCLVDVQLLIRDYSLYESQWIIGHHTMWMCLTRLVEWQ